MTNCAAAPAATLKLARILAPVDFSDSCRRAAQDAEALARHFGSELVLLHAVPPVSLPLGPAEALAYSNAAELTLERVAEVTPVLEGFLADELHGLATRRVLVEADPTQAIVDYTEDHHCDLVVMPTHGYGAIHRIVLGSVTAEVLHRSHCPVWTGCHFENTHSAFRTVICAVDLGADNRAAVQWAAGFARAYGAALHLLHAIPESTIHSGPMYFDPDWHSHVANEARRRMNSLAVEAGITAAAHVPVGDITEVLNEAAQDLHADLIVIARGAKAYSIIRAAPCPVVAV